MDYGQISFIFVIYNKKMSEDIFINRLLVAHKDCVRCPSTITIKTFFDQLLSVLFPVYSENKLIKIEEIKYKLDGLKLSLTAMLPPETGEEKTETFFAMLPTIYNAILEDVDAMFQGDPAAKSHDEIIRSYPGFYAISAYRIAHQMHLQKIDILPRTITEIAHSKTGIDIHPGATIGSHFCIDHGTGVVIGETTHIGNYVKLYQGVTLGALSVSKTDATAKRHPTLEDHVVIYAGTTILGGNTVIGAHSVIGGNVWLPKSVPPHSKVYYKAQMHDTASDKTDLYIFS